MKMYRFLPLFFLIPISLFAQKIKIHWGPEFKTKVYPHSIKLIGVEDDHFYLLNDMTKKDKKVLRFKLHDGEATESDFDLEYNDDPLEKLRFINTKNNILGISSISYKKDKSLELISFQLNNGEFTNPEPVYEHAFKRYTKGIAPILYVPESNDDLETGISYSFDKTKVLFANSLSSQDTKKEDQMAIAVFDAELNLLWDKIQDTGYSDKKLEIMSAFVADNGKEVFVSASLVKNKKDYDYKIFRITENDFREYELVLNEKVNPSALALFYKESEQTLILGGLYVLRSEGIAHGVFGGKLDLSKDFNDELNYSKFDKEDKDKNTKAEYHIADMASLANGNFQLLLEGRFTSSSGSSTTGTGEIYYHYKDLVLTTIDGNGGLVNTQKIDRNAESEDKPRNGHFFFPYGDHTYLLYDSKMTEEDKKKYKVSSMMNLQTIAKLCCFDQDGKLVRQKMLFTSKDDRYFCYSVNAAVYGNQLYFLGMEAMNFGSQYHNQRSVQLGSINLDEFH